MLLFPFFLFANAAVTENDPASLVEGVSVITGHFYTAEEDYVIQGQEPIRLPRTHISGSAAGYHFGHLSASQIVRSKIFSVAEPNGTSLLYLRHPKNPLRYEVWWSSTQGMTNTASGKISALTNLKNQHIIAESKQNSFTLYCANGTKKRYQGFPNQKPQDLGYGSKAFLLYEYKLISEELPNGNKIQYFWTQDNQLGSIQTTNPQGTKVYAKLICPQGQSNGFSPSAQFTGSDERSLTYY